MYYKCHCICNLRCAVPKEIPIISQNQSNYNFDLMIKHLFEKSFETNDINYFVENNK